MFMPISFMRNLLLTGSMLFMLPDAHGQVKYGIKAGGNLANVRYIEEDISKARLGVNAGIAVEAVVGQQLIVRPEVLYSGKGFGFRATAGNMDGTQRLNYIAIPILLGYYPTKKLSLLAGPEFGFLRKAVAKLQGITTYYTNLYRHFDVGVDLGTAYNFSKQFSLEARYNHGFKGLVNSVYTDNSGNITGQGKNGANSVLQFGFVWWLSE